MITFIAASAVLSLVSKKPGFVRWRKSAVKPGVTAAGTLLLIATLLAASATPAGAADDGFSAYQQKVLFNPDESVRKAEARGRVTIYDGLDEKQVEAALDTQFDRIEHMMFVRTRQRSEDGTTSYDDDGCD
jgi:hypothetical protein